MKFFFGKQKTIYLKLDMNGDQGTTRNDAFPNVPKKITIHKKYFFFLIPFHSFFCREIKNKIIHSKIWEGTFVPFHSCYFIYLHSFFIYSFCFQNDADSQTIRQYVVIFFDRVVNFSLYSWVPQETEIGINSTINFQYYPIVVIHQLFYKHRYLVLVIY